MTAFLSTGKGKVVRAPQFVDICRNCEQPTLGVRFNPALETRTGYRVSLKCEGCGLINESFVVEPKVKPR